MIELITKIKHFFAEIKRNRMLKELGQIFQDERNKMLKEHGYPPEVSFSEIDILDDYEINELGELGNSQDFSLDPFNFEFLPEKVQLEVLRKLDSKSLLAGYQTSKTSKRLIETHLLKELKKARLECYAFLKWERFLSHRIYQRENSQFDSYFGLKDFESLIERFAPCYAKEILTTLNRLLIFSKDYQVGKYQFKGLIKVAKAVSLSHPKATIEVLKNAVHIRLYEQKIQTGKNSEVLKCIKLIAEIDPTSATEYLDLLRFHMNAIRNEPNKMLDYFEVLGLIAPESLNECGNLLRFNRMDSNPFQSRKTVLLRNIAWSATPFNLEQIFDTISRIQNESLKEQGLCMLMAGARTRNVPESIPFIQQIIETSQNFTQEHKNGVLCMAVKTYIHFGKLEEAMATIDLISNSSWKNFALIDLAKAYTCRDPNQSHQLLMRVEKNDDFYKELLAKAYALIDIEKAQEICNQIQDPDCKIKALFTIAKVLKKTNIQAANQIWENILILTAHIDDVRQPYLNLLKIVREMAKISPSDAKTFLENKLQPLTRRELFEEIVQNRRNRSRRNRSRRNRSRGHGIYCMDNFKKLISAYSRIDPLETENWMKEFNRRIGSGYQSKALMALRDSII